MTERAAKSAAKPKVEPPTPKERANAKQRRREAEAVERATLDEGAVPDGARRVKVVDGEQFVLVNGGWVHSGKAR